jgi:hypothetical protein
MREYVRKMIRDLAKVLKEKGVKDEDVEGAEGGEKGNEKAK